MYLPTLLSLKADSKTVVSYCPLFFCISTDSALEGLFSHGITDELMDNIFSLILCL